MQRFRRGVLLAGGLLVSVIVQAQTDAGAPAKPFRYDTLAMILALLALIGLVLLWMQIRQLAQKPASDKRTGTVSAAEFSEVSGRVSILEKQNKQLVDRVAKLETVVTQLRERPAPRNEPQKQPEPVAQKLVTPAEPTPPARPNRSSESPPPNNPSWQTQRPVANALPAKLYARTADVPGGFSVNSLVENPNRPMVFVIVPTGPASATFRVADDPEAQRLALSDPYSYLSDACNYQSRPDSNSRIHTVTDGKLQLQGEKWHIVEKAEISFYA